MSVHTPSGPADGTETAPQLRPPGDGALFLIAIVAFAAVVAWGAAITLAVMRLLGHTDLAFAVLLVGAAVTLTLSAVHLRLDLSRRRRLGKALDHIAGCFAAAQAEQVEHLAAVAARVEQISAAGMERTRANVDHLSVLAAAQTTLADEMVHLREAVEKLVAHEGLTPGVVESDDAASRAAASQVFEMGRRIGLRQAARADAVEAAPPGS